MTQRMGFHPPVTDDSVHDWDEWHCCCHHHPPVPIWPTKYTEDMGCNLDLSTNGVMPHHQFLRRNWFCDYSYWRSMKFDFSSCAHCSKLWSCLAQFETHVHSMMHLSGGQASWAMSCACIRMWNQLESSSVVGSSSNTCFCWITHLFWNSHSEKKEMLKIQKSSFFLQIFLFEFFGENFNISENI